MSDAGYVIWEQQPDGSEVGIDFGVPGPFGDFALGFRFAGEVTRVAAVYHTAESSLFVTLLEHWARSVDPSQVLTDIELVRTAITETTAGLAKTSRSENDFRTEIDRIHQLARADTLPQPARFRDEGGDQLTVSPTDTGLDLIAENAAERWSVQVANGSVPRLAAGMIWRSYCDEGSAIPLTRLNTRVYFEALDAFETAIRTRTSATDQP